MAVFPAVVARAEWNRGGPRGQAHSGFPDGGPWFHVLIPLVLRSAYSSSDGLGVISTIHRAFFRARESSSGPVVVVSLQRRDFEPRFHVDGETISVGAVMSTVIGHSVENFFAIPQ